MRYINQTYIEIAEGYNLASELSSGLNEHPAIQSWFKRRVVQRKRSLRILLLFALGTWLLALGSVLLLILVAMLITTGSLFAILLAGFLFLVAFVLSVLTLGVAIRKTTLPAQCHIMTRWASIVMPSESQSFQKLNQQFNSNSSNSITQKQTTYGVRGVHATLSVLNQRLNHEWYALTNLMIAGGEDADLVIVGPSGVWVLESKWWSGYINIKNGKWSQVQVYYEKGGRRKTRHNWINPPWDKQWLRQRDRITKILRKSTPALAVPVLGGIVLSHEKATLNSDHSEQAMIATPYGWARIMLGSQSQRVIDQMQSLQIIDDLLIHARQNQHKVSPVYSASDLSRKLFQDVLMEASKRR